MKVNMKHLGAMAVARPENNIKTGWLHIKEKEKETPKRRWVVLKANFLFFFRKEIQLISDLVGCLLLEKFDIRVSNEDAFEFAISFEQYSQAEILFQCANKAELMMWREAIRSSCHEYTRAVHALVSKRAESMGMAKLPFDPFKTYPEGTPLERVAYSDFMKLGALPEVVPDDTPIVLKIALSATGILGTSGALQGNSYIAVMVKYVNWINYHRTDVQRDQKPEYKKELVFRYCKSRAKKMKETKLRLIVFMDNGLRSNEIKTGFVPKKEALEQFRPSAIVDCTVGQLTEASGQDLVLPLQRHSDIGIPFKGSVRLRVVQESADTPSRGARISAVVKLGKKIEGPIYKFPMAKDSSSVVRATEIMGESAYFRTIPMQLLNIYCNEDRTHINELTKLADVVGEDLWIEHVKPWFEHICKRMTTYMEQVATLERYVGSAFRKSVDKKSKELEMTAINCHIQRLHVLKEEGNTAAAVYDIITHGAPAAHSLSFKEGGLRSIMKKNEKLGTKLWDTCERYRLQVKHTVQSISKLVKILDEKFSIEACSVNSGDGSELQFHDADLGVIQQILGETQVLSGIVTNGIIASALQSTIPIRQQRQQSNWTVIEGAEVVAQPVEVLDGGTKQRRGASVDKHSARDHLQISAELLQSIAHIEKLTATDLSPRRKVDELLELEKLVQGILQEVSAALLLEAIAKDQVDEFVHRRDIVFSQAVTCLVTSFVSTLVVRRKDRIFLESLYHIGFLAQFESLLSTHGKEMGMIEDMAVGVEELRGVKFRLERTADNVDPFDNVKVEGKRYNIRITIHVPSQMYDSLPPEPVRSQLISVNPVFFSHGVNEMQTLANKVGETELQEEICKVGLQNMCDFGARYKHFATKKMGAVDSSDLIIQIDRHLGDLESAIHTHKAKNINILTMAEEVTRLVKGGRLTCCKSGKDRTGMSSTLEQANILINRHGMDPEHLQAALNLMRSMGTRMANVEKNIGQKKYAFNKIQMYALPKLLRPPIMNIGGTIT